MHLWTEYEGRTIAGDYTLGKLLRSEGRNGFFATSAKSGTSAVIRITEAHFDEDALLERWRQVAGIHQHNLIEIERVGKASFDGVPLTFALMEPNDANLADVLRERPLTAAETSEIARSVLAALTALHASGLVHEHIEPANILAVGETVKLRSDCVRECIADTEFNTPEGCADLRRRDIHDFGRLLLQCLTLEKEWNPSLNIPEPFKRIIPNALEGNWTLEQISSFFASPSTAQKTAAAAPAPAHAEPSKVPGITPAGSAAAAREPAATAARKAEEAETPQPALSFRPRNQLHAIDEPASFRFRTSWAAYAGVAAVIVLAALLAWHFLGAKSAPTTDAIAPSQPPAPIVNSAATAPAARSESVAPIAAPAPAQQLAGTGPAAVTPGWYVIAYTYNHQPQAETKADRLKLRHPGLDFRVLHPTGHGAFLVTVGGPMTEPEATAAMKHARRSGLPRDTYIHRY